MQPFSFYIINFLKIKTLFTKCLFAMPPIIYVNNISLIVTWNESRSATRTFFAYGCSHCTCKIFYEYWITHVGFRMRGCYSHYFYFSVNCIPCKLPVVKGDYFALSMQFLLLISLWILLCKWTGGFGKNWWFTVSKSVYHVLSDFHVTSF